MIGAVVAATAVWSGALAVFALLRRPREPVAGPPTLDLGPEPPAVVNFVTNDFRLTPDAVPATLLDLAARGVVELEHRGPDEFVCRLESTPPAGSMTPYEERVAAHLRAHAVGGIVPSGALTTGPAEQSSRWWQAFANEVVADAQARGLSRPLLDGKLLRWLVTSALALAVLYGVVFDNWLPGAGAAFVLLGSLVAVERRHAQRETPAGLEAASRWLGVKAKLHEDEVFPTLPPITVGLWERYLAYGAALGVAPGAVRPIPMGAESNTRAWSSYGGNWRPVQIDYPAFSPPAWGKRPAGALLRAAIAGTIAVLLLYFLGGSVADSAGRSGGWGVLFAAIVFVPLGLIAWRAAVVGVRALADLGHPQVVTGEILRLRAYGDKNKRYYVAVDDGASERIRAWALSPQLYRTLHQQQLVTARVTRNLCYVESISPAKAAPAPTAPLQAAPQPPAPGAPG